MRADAKNPIAFSPSFCAAGARYPSPCGRRDGRDFPPCAALDIPHLPHIAFFAFHSRHFCRVAMSFSPQSDRRFAGIRNSTPRADARAGPGAAPNRRAWKQVSAKRRGINARCRIAMQSAIYAEIYADMPTLCLDARASAQSSLVRAPHKSIPPRNAGALGGRLQQRSGVQTQFWSVPFIGDSLLQVNRNCRGRDVNAVERSLGKGEVISSILTGSTRMLSLARCSRRSWIASRCAAR